MIRSADYAWSKGVFPVTVGAGSSSSRGLQVQASLLSFFVAEEANVQAEQIFFRDHRRQGLVAFVYC